MAPMARKLPSFKVAIVVVRNANVEKIERCSVIATKALLINGLIRDGVGGRDSLAYSVCSSPWSCVMRQFTDPSVSFL